MIEKILEEIKNEFSNANANYLGEFEGKYCISLFYKNEEWGGYNTFYRLYDEKTGILVEEVDAEPQLDDDDNSRLRILNDTFKVFWYQGIITYKIKYLQPQSSLTILKEKHIIPYSKLPGITLKVILIGK